MAAKQGFSTRSREPLVLQLVYISTARQILTEAELDEVLKISRRNNALVDVTGLLVVGGRRFLQALEGPEEMVIATFERIKADPRHFGVVELSRKSVQVRGFGDWSMGYEAGAEAADGNLNAIIGALVEPLADLNLRSLFTGFGELHARAA